MSFVAKAVTAVVSIGLFGLLLRGKEPEKQRLGDISAQTAKEAEPRVIVYGRVRPIGGNIIYCQTPVKRWVKQKTEGGKGGSSKKTQKVENVFRTYAIGVCEGPITGFTRIWRNNKLVYDARGNEWGEKNNPVFLKSFRLYLGGWDQMPAPELERVWGVGNVPGHRGTAFMTAIDENLTDSQGMVPQWLFEVERAEYIATTSKLYGLLDRDIVLAQHAIPDSINIRTVIHRPDYADSLNAEHSVPDDIFIRNMYRDVADIDAVSVNHAAPDDIDIETGSWDSTYSEVVRVNHAFPDSVLINTTAIRNSYFESLNVNHAVPDNITVITP